MGRRLWEEISKQLNEVPNGASKRWEQWRKMARLKKNAKAKSVRITQHMRCTWGGEATEEKLNAMEREIVDLINPTLIHGHQDVAEPSVKILMDIELEDMLIDSGNLPIATSAAIEEKVLFTAEEKISSATEISSVSQTRPSTSSKSRTETKKLIRTPCKIQRLNRSLETSDKLLLSAQNRNKYEEEYKNKNYLY